MDSKMLSNASTVKRKEFTVDSKGLPFVSMGASTKRKTSPLGARIVAAIEAEGRTQTSTETAMIAAGHLSGRGQLSSLITGRRGTHTVDPEMLGALADLLHVDFEWLARGKGAMRRGGREATVAEEAIVFARSNGAREDAIKAAWERNQDRAPTMTAWDWVRAIDAEAIHLERMNVPRPEVTASAQYEVRREKSRLERANARKKASEPEPKKEPDHHDNPLAHASVRRVARRV